MNLFAWVWTAILGQLQSVFNVDSPTGPVALGGALVFCALFYVEARRKRGRKISIDGFFTSVFPSRILWHASSRLDMRLWVVNTLVFASAYSMLAIGSLLWRNATLALLELAFGPGGFGAWPVWAILTTAT